jgi:hypothetical protein
MPLPPRQASRTLLLVGEGETEVAFLSHVKGIYAPRGCGLSVRVLNARGKGPENVVETVVRHAANRGYESLAALLDTDIPWSVEVNRRAVAASIKLVGSTPCLEGLLLDVMGQAVPRRSADCKRTFAIVFRGDPLRADAYARQFDRPVLDAARTRVVALRQLLELFT